MSFLAALHGLVDLLAPPRCAGCDLPLEPEDGAHFCGACEPLLERTTGALATHAPYVFGGPLADAIRRYKLAQRTELAAPLGALLAEEARLRHAGAIDVVVPVPLHPARLRQRGFDHVALLAARAARAIGARYEPWALARVRDTPAQATLDRKHRSTNVAGCFAVRRSLDGARVLVIDDVRTTGATLYECARAVDDAGARRITLLALAAAE